MHLYSYLAKMHYGKDNRKNNWENQETIFGERKKLTNTISKHYLTLRECTIQENITMSSITSNLVILLVYAYIAKGVYNLKPTMIFNQHTHSIRSSGVFTSESNGTKRFLMNFTVPTLIYLSMLKPTNCTRS